MVVWTLGILRRREREQALVSWSATLKRSLNGRGCSSEGARGRRESYSWAPRSNLLSVSAPGWRLLPRYAREDPDTVFPADGIPSVLWEVLPALSEAAPGGWDRVLLGH